MIWNSTKESFTPWFCFLYICSHKYIYSCLNKNRLERDIYPGNCRDTNMNRQFHESNKQINTTISQLQNSPRYLLIKLFITQISTYLGSSVSLQPKNKKLCNIHFWNIISLLVNTLNSVLNNHINFTLFSENLRSNFNLYQAIDLQMLLCTFIHDKFIFIYKRSIYQYINIIIIIHVCLWNNRTGKLQLSRYTILLENT